MRFQSLLLALAFLLASTTAVILQPKEQLANPLSSWKKFQEIRDPGVPGPVDANEEVEAFLATWHKSLIFSGVDNTKFDDETVEIDKSEIVFRNTHLRGAQRIGHAGDGKRQFINDFLSYLTFTAISNALEFHSELVYRGNSGSSLEMRVSANIKNMNLATAIRITPSYPLPDQMTIQYLQVANTPNVSVSVKTLDSQFGDPQSSETQRIMAQVEDYIRTTYIPKLLNGLLTKSKIAVNQLMQDYSKLNNEPFAMHGDAPTHFFNYRKEMCPSYRLGLNHTLEFENAGSDKVIIHNGVIRGLDYLSRTECGSETECFEVQCDYGQFIYNVDDIYIDYETVAYVNGVSHTGKTTVTISGMQGKDSYFCATYCPGFYCFYWLETLSRSFTKLGKVMVDVEGLPETLRLRHRDLIAFAENSHGKFIDQITGGSFNATEHFDNEHCQLN